MGAICFNPCQHVPAGTQRDSPRWLPSLAKPIIRPQVCPSLNNTPLDRQCPPSPQNHNCHEHPVSSGPGIIEPYRRSPAEPPILSANFKTADDQPLCRTEFSERTAVFVPYA